MKKYNETMIVRNGKLTYAVNLNENTKGDRGTYIYMDNGKIYFNQDSWISSNEFNFNNETHRIAKEIFINQLQTDIKTRVLELKQLQEVFNELNLSECLQDIIPTSAKMLEDVKKEVYQKLDNKVIDINKSLEEKVEQQINENIKPIARKRKKKVENKEKL